MMNDDRWKEERKWLDRLERLTGIYVATILVGSLLFIALMSLTAQ